MKVAALDIGPLPEGRQRSRFLAVASFDSSVRVLSLDPADTLKVRSSRPPRPAPLNTETSKDGDELRETC